MDTGRRPVIVSGLKEIVNDTPKQSHKGHLVKHEKKAFSREPFMNG